jgi:exonuclease VII small subunit
MRDETIIDKHESYGMASFSRVQSTGTNLFASEFKHQHFMTFSISRGERHRDLSRDWYFDREQLIEIALSEAQFVELITSPNMGCGVPVTITRFEGKLIDSPPVREEMKRRYSEDMKKDAKKCVADLDSARKELEDAIESGKTGKNVLREISKKLDYAAAAIRSGIPFVAHQFEEAMENTISHARVEIEAHVSSMAMRIGVESMRLEAKAAAPKLIEGEQLAGGER